MPIPSISISSDSLSPIPYQATLLTLNCTAHVNSKHLNTTLNWDELDSTNKRITQKEVLTEGLKLETDLIFNPLASNDTGNYTCTVTVTPIGSSFTDDIIPYIMGISESGRYSVSVQGNIKKLNKSILKTSNQQSCYKCFKVFYMTLTCFLCRYT